MSEGRFPRENLEAGRDCVDVVVGPIGAPPSAQDGFGHQLDAPKFAFLEDDARWLRCIGF